MDRIDEIAMYHTADEIYSMGMDYLYGTNGKVRLETTAFKYLCKAEEMGSPEAKAFMRKARETGAYQDEDDMPIELIPGVVVEEL